MDSRKVLPTLYICRIVRGGAHVLSQKQPSKVEVYNDIDVELVNFLMMLREQREELIAAVDSLPVSRALFEKWKWEEKPSDDFERAVRWWYVAVQSFGGTQRMKSGWKHSKTTNVATRYHNSCETLNSFEERIRNVLIECRDFREVIQTYDAEDTLHYVDPPYRGYEFYYHGGFSEQDHHDLAELLHNVKGKVILSYYEDEVIGKLYSDWH